MTSLQRLAAMGCGEAILNSVIDRGNIHAAISNAKTFLKYYNHAVKTGLCTKEQAIDGLYPYYNKLKAVEYLVNNYKALWEEKYCKVLLQCEKFIGNNNIAH